MTVCQTCGSEGYTNLLIYCEACKLVAVHRYCVDGPLNIDDDEFCWSCEECVPRIGQPVVASRKSKRIGSILDREVLRRKARRNWKSHSSVSKIEDPNCVGERANKDSKVASDVDEKKIEIAKGKQGNLKEIGTVAKEGEGEKVLNCDDGASKTSLQPIVVLALKSVDLDENKNGNVKRKQVKFKDNGTVTKKGDSQPALQIQPENKVLNSDGGAGEESLQPSLVLGLISEDLINSNVKGEDLQTNFEKKLISEDFINSNVKGEDLQTNLEKKLISEDSNNSNVKGEDPQTNLEKKLGPELSIELDHSLQNTSKADETNNGDSVSEKWHKNEQSFSDLHSSLVEEKQEIGRSEAAKWPDGEEEMFIDNIEETNVVSASHQRCDKPSGFRVYDRKKRRLVIAMEYSDSDEEPDDVKDEHPQIAPNQQQGFLNASSSEPPANKGDYEFAYKSFMKSDDCFPTRPSLMQSDNHKLTQTSSTDFDNNAIPQLSPVMLEHYVPAQPIINAVWRGQCSIRNYAHPQSFGLEAHLSNKAHAKVLGAASALPNLLHFEIVRKRDAWPMNFNESPPTSDAIGLYFFPVEERDEKWYMHQLDEMIDCDLMLKSQINNGLELLVFCSQELPREERRFQCKLYLWGVFMRKQETSLASEPSDIQTSDTKYHRRDSAVPCAGRSSVSPSSVHNCPVTNSSNSHLHHRVELKPNLFLKHRRPAYKKQGYDRQPKMAMSCVDRHDHKTSRNFYKPGEHSYGNKDAKYPYNDRGSNLHRGQDEIRQGKSTNKWKDAPSRHSSHSRRPYRSPTR